MHDDDRLELPRSPRPESEWEIEIVELNSEGWGVGYLPALVGPQQEPKEFTFVVRKALPGDRARVEVERRSGERVEAHVTEWLEASSQRVEPRCRHFGRREVEGEGCGGCTLQSLDYERQLVAKREYVRRAMQAEQVPAGGIEPVIGQDSPWFYRNKMEFSFGDTADREFALGLHPRGYRYEIVNLQECFLQSEFVSAFVPRVRAWAADRGLEPYLSSRDTGFLRTLTVREGERTGDRLVELTTTHDERAEFGGGTAPAEEVAESFVEQVGEIASDLESEVTSIYWTQKRTVEGEPTRHFEHHLAGEETLAEELHLPGGHVLSFDISPRAFFQPNTRQAERLYAEVLDRTGLRSGGAETVLDLYCGTGTIAVAMAPYAECVGGVEEQSDAVADARSNAQTNDLDGYSFACGRVGEVLEDPPEGSPFDSPDVVVVDPPRAGLLPDARDQIAELSPPRIVYVSCNPETQAEDLGRLTDRGYAVGGMTPVDMFPHTYHVENVAVLERA